MCSVVGYCGSHAGLSVIIEGLSRLEYRGYDSAGCALVDSDGALMTMKVVGGVDVLREECRALLHRCPTEQRIAIGHTRWSTHGEVSIVNAHPHTDCTRSVAVVHNGIIENCYELKEQLLLDGHHIVSQTDSELIAHLIEQEGARSKTPHALLAQVVARLEGAYALLIIDIRFPDTLLAVRKSSPLCIGRADGVSYAASDPLAFAGKVDEVLYLPESSYAVITPQSVVLYDFSGHELTVPAQRLLHTWENEGRGAYDHYMKKEIFQQPRVLQDTVSFLRRIKGRLIEQLGLDGIDLGSIKRLHFIACGTSYNAASIAALYFEEIVRIPVEVHIASEFRGKEAFVQDHELYIFISQSGETADTLEALRLVTQVGGKTVALVNVAPSSMVREAGGFLLTQAGYEMAVASTKAFSAQVATSFWLAHWWAVQIGLQPVHVLALVEQELDEVSAVLIRSMQQYEHEVIQQQLAPYFASFSRVFFIGRQISYSFAREAALKLKELAYIFVDTQPAGELKHGPLALVDEYVPVFLFSCLDERVYRKLIVCAQEIKARKGKICVWAFEGQHELLGLADQAFIFPRVSALLAPLAMTGVMQLLVYHIACALDRPVDRPRNLAKSVTVE